MRRAAFAILTAALALAGCGGEEQDAAQKARRAAVEAERGARKALIKAAPAEWEAYRNKGKETYRNKGYSLIKQVMLSGHLDEDGYHSEYLYDYDVKKERDALIKAAPAEWGAYITAFKAGYAAREAMWIALREAEGALRNAAPDEWKGFDGAFRSVRRSQNDGYLERRERMKRFKAAEAALKQAAPEQWKTYKAAEAEVKELGMPVK